MCVNRLAISRKSGQFEDVDAKALQIENQRLRAKIVYLEAQVGEYQRMVHGRKRERFIPVESAEQLSLFGKLKKASRPAKEGPVAVSQQAKRPSRKEVSTRPTHLLWQVL